MRVPEVRVDISSRARIVVSRDRDITRGMGCWVDGIGNRPRSLRETKGGIGTSRCLSHSSGREVFILATFRHVIHGKHIKGAPEHPPGTEAEREPNARLEIREVTLIQVPGGMHD